MCSVAGNLCGGQPAASRNRIAMCIYLVAEALGGNDSDFIADTLVCLEVEGELGIVSPVGEVVSNLATSIALSQTREINGI
jgi:hypothetical protein